MESGGRHEVSLLAKSQLMVGLDGKKFWKKVGYTVGGLELYNKDNHLIQSSGTRLDLRGTNGQLITDLRQAQQRVVELIENKTLTTSRDFSGRNILGGLGVSAYRLIEWARPTAYKGIHWLSSGGKLSAEDSQAIDRYFEQEKRDLAKLLGVDPGSLTFQRSQAAGDVVITAASVTSGAAALTKLPSLVRAAPAVARGLRGIPAFGRLAPALESAPSLLTTWHKSKTALPVAFGTIKGINYAATDYFTRPGSTLVGLFTDPGFYIATGQGVAEGSLIRWGASRRLANGESMAQINHILKNDIVFWSGLNAFASAGTRALTGEKVLTPQGALKTAGAFVNGGLDYGAFGGFLPGAVFPLQYSRFS